MGGKMARDKGQRGEKELCKLLQPHVDKVYAEHGLESPSLERNLSQTRDGGFDIAGLDWIALEVKRVESLNINQWWDQTVAQAQGGRTPVLAYRQNHKPWRVVMRGYLDGGGRLVQARVEISKEKFIHWFEVKLDQYLRSFVLEQSDGE